MSPDVFVTYLPGCSNVDVIDAAGRLGNGSAVFAEPSEMKFDCLAKNGLSVFNRRAGRNTAWKIGHVAGKIAFCFFNHDRVAHIGLTS